jgi:hypothetical protein
MLNIAPPHLLLPYEVNPSILNECCAILSASLNITEGNISGRLIRGSNAIKPVFLWYIHLSFRSSVVYVSILNDLHVFWIGVFLIFKHCENFCSDEKYSYWGEKSRGFSALIFLWIWKHIIRMAGAKKAEPGIDWIFHVIKPVNLKRIWISKKRVFCTGPW